MRSVGLAWQPLPVYAAVRLEVAELAHSTADRPVFPTSGDRRKLDAGNSTAGTKNSKALGNVR